MGALPVLPLPNVEVESECNGVGGDEEVEADSEDKISAGKGSNEIRL